MTADAIDTAPRVLSQRRLEQLRTVGLFPGGRVVKQFLFTGPLVHLDRFLDEEVSATVDLGVALGTFATTDEDADKPWGHVLVYVEPCWRVTHGPTGWKVWEDWGHRYDANDLTNAHWETEELANRYLELLTDQFWTRVSA